MSFPQRVTGLLVAGAIAAALVFYVFWQIDSLLGRRDREITQRSAELVKLHAANVRWRAKLEAAERRHQAAAAAAHDHANELRGTVAHLPVEQRPPRILVQIASKDSTAYAMCSVALYTCQQRATLAEQEAHRLTYQLDEQRKVRDRRCGISGGYGLSVYNEYTRHADSTTTTAPRVRWAFQLGLTCRLWRVPLVPLP